MKKYIIAALALAAVGSIASAQSLMHRYSFDSDASDSVGGVDGTLAGGASVSGGSVSFDGVDGHVTFDGSAIAINTYSEVSLEFWFTADPANASVNEMIAAFGMEDGHDTEPWGTDYLIVNSINSDASRATITDEWWNSEAVAEATTSWNDGLEHHVVATVDDTDVSLYVDGALAGSSALTTQSLAALSNADAFLARSVYSNDAFWTGSINEFRIWDAAFDESTAAASFALGPNEVIPEPSTYAAIFGALALAGAVYFRRRRNG